MISKLILLYIVVEVFEWFSSWGSLAQQKQPTYAKHINISGMCLSYLLSIVLGSIGLYYLGNIKLVYFIIGAILLFWLRDIVAGIITKLFMLFQYRLYHKYQIKKLKEESNESSNERDRA